MRKRKIINWTLCSSHANLDFEHLLFNSYSMRCFFFIKKHELKYTQFRIKTASLFFSYDISSSTFSLWYIYRVLIKKLIIYRAFSVTWSAAMQKLLGIKGSFNMWKEFNSHRIFFIHKHGRRFIVLYTNMAVVMSCENDLLNQSNIWPPKRAEKANSTQPVCGKFPVTWTLFQTKISDLPYPICRPVPLCCQETNDKTVSNSVPVLTPFPNFKRGGSVPKSNPVDPLVPLLTEKISLSHTSLKICIPFNCS